MGLLKKLKQIKEENGGKGLWQVAWEDYQNWKIEKITNILLWGERKKLERLEQRTKNAKVKQKRTNK